MRFFSRWVFLVTRISNIINKNMNNKTQPLKIAIVGVGMVGTPLARYFEEIRGMKRGKELFLYDKNPEKKMRDNFSKADIVFVTVPTPRNPKDGSCDLSIVNEIFSKIKDGRIAVLKSTVPPGTTVGLQKKFSNLKVLFSPEFLTESRAWEDTLRPDRQIVGFTDNSYDAAGLVLSVLPKAPFMSPWGKDTYTPVRISATEAEIIKYAGNVYFVRKVNWANALAKAADKFGVDYKNIRMGMSADFRIGDSHLDVDHGGYRGWGGYCFPKDLDAFIQFSKQNGLEDVYEMLMADRNFNEKLLESQGLSLAEVSDHDNTLKEKLAKKRIKN